ncbi:MAG: aminoglycoside phosphotransferase [Rhodospirillales bacterium]|nr:aminoglycoside phosphotransferase [Rhodospirillales bacterium]
METLTDDVLIARALASVPGIGVFDPGALERLPLKGLMHTHWRIRGRDLVLRAPRAGDAADLVRQAAAFARMAASGRTPKLAAAADLPALAQTLAAIHRLPLPSPSDRLPLASPPDPFADALITVERNAAYLARANVMPDARAQIEAELDWARGFAAANADPLARGPRALIVSDAHPGNFLVRADGIAVFLDLERALYGAPAIDLAHATLRPATRWDGDCDAVLSPDDTARFHAAYFAAAGPVAEEALRPWLLPMRRLTWLRTTTAFARFRAAGALAGLAPERRAHAENVIADSLDPEIIAGIRRIWTTV